MWLPSERVRPCPSPSTASWRVRSWPLTRFPNSPLISVVSVVALVYRTYSTCEQIIPYAGNATVTPLRGGSPRFGPRARPPAPRMPQLACPPGRGALPLVIRAVGGPSARAARECDRMCSGPLGARARRYRLDVRRTSAVAPATVECRSYRTAVEVPASLHIP